MNGTTPAWRELYDFWFQQEEAKWFEKNEKFDKEIHDRFAPWLDSLSKEEKAKWKEDPKGYLALILLLDQVPRNSFRNTPKSFAYDGEALSLCLEGLGRIDTQLSGKERMFFYLPLQHSEQWDMQMKSVTLSRESARLNKDESVAALLKENQKYADRHCEIVERFGRFPHRNQILGRKSTPIEIAFLKEPNSSF